LIARLALCLLGLVWLTTVAAQPCGGAPWDVETETLDAIKTLYAGPVFFADYLDCITP
jgi:hypothetical protein